ncbi:FixH family protein, partial [Colwellia sp. MB3u-70]|uniref:FixH family protein n=1 Tax=Colwellia sp. MB3u-70 TaxID=2759819 RepID=UPI0028704FFA
MLCFLLLTIKHLRSIPDQLIIRPTGIEKEFPLLNVNFYHPTLADRDFSLVLTPDGNG